MALTKTPICDFGKKADDFELKSTENKMVSFTLLHASGFWGGLRTQRPEHRPPA